MDIVNFDALKAQDRIIDPSQVDPDEDYFILGKYTNHYTTNSQKYTKYPVYAIKAGDVMGGGGTPTLQQVLDFNHDLVDGNNFQGTGAGSGNTGIGIIANGTNAANGNTGDRVVAIGEDAAINNSGLLINAIGTAASFENTGNGVTAIGNGAARSNTGNSINAIGSEAAKNNTGNFVNAIGSGAGKGNSGDNVIALGTGAGSGNPLSGMFIISNSELPSYADHAAAVAAISPTGIPNNTYIYHNQATMSIGAVRL